MFNPSAPTAYPDLTRKNPSRKTLVKLRMSSHKLRIEAGTYDSIPRDESYAVSAIAAELKLKHTFYKIFQVFLR